MRVFLFPVLLLLAAGCQELPTEPEPVDPDRDRPIGIADFVTVDEDSFVDVRPLENDSIRFGADLVLQGIGTPNHGAARLFESGEPAFRYEPLPNFNGRDSVRYTFRNELLPGAGWVFIEVLPVNDKPVAEDDQFAIETGAQPTAGSKQQAFTLDVLANDSDIDGDALSVIRVSAPETGTASIPQNSQAISYTPPQIFSGTVEITYVVTDGALNDTASVMVDVTAVDERPVARDDAFDLDEDASLQLDILANDTDPENDPLTVEIIEEVQNGTLQPLPNSRFRYTPNQNFAGSDGFTYRVSDGTFVSDTATVTIRVRPVNDLPLALNDTYDLGSDQTLNEPAPGVLANDSDPDIGDELRARLIDNVQNGVLTLQPNGSFSYRPNAGFSGTDTFTYRAGDGFSESNIATVTLRVEQSNRPPQAADDALEVQHGRVLDIRISTDVLANDTDADGDDLTFELTAGTTQGDLVQIDGDQWTYTPRVEFVGQDTFRYRARDASTASNVATVTISVVNSNLPVAVDDSLTTTLDQEIVIDPVALLSNDTDADGDTLTVIFDSPPSNGSLIENADGTVTYFPNAGFQGVDQFTYRASDGIALSEPAAVVITVE